MKRTLVSLAVASILAAPASYATNGMNLEGYGPIAAGMGGASMAYDNGVAAIMNNPATLGAMEEGDRLDLAVGFLGPNVSTRIDSMNLNSDSGGTAYWMPAVGWAHKSGQLTYGAGVFSQGGMGTEYAANSPLAMGSGQDVRSEVGVGRFILPLAYSVNKQLSVAATLDYVWAGMDLKMAMGGNDLGGMMMRGMGMDVPAMGEASGTMVAGMQQMGLTPDMINWVRFDFSNNSDFTGEAKGGGFAGKLGVMYQATPEISVGMSYHSKTNMGDLETDNGYVSMSTPMGVQKIKGKISVKDFQWPATLGAGIAYKPRNGDWMIAADISHIRWADVMKNFSLGFTAATIPENGPFGGAGLDATMYQNWSNQTAFRVGGEYLVSDQITLRAGLNIAKNPVPDSTLNYLFPAIVRDHVTLGLGYALSKKQDINFSFTYAPEDKNTNAAGGFTTSHSQTNWSLMYSHKF